MTADNACSACGKVCVAEDGTSVWALVIKAGGTSEARLAQLGALLAKSAEPYKVDEEYRFCYACLFGALGARPT